MMMSRHRGAHWSKAEVRRSKYGTRHLTAGDPYQDAPAQKARKLHKNLKTRKQVKR
jgi:hypothetical protein